MTCTPITFASNFSRGAPLVASEVVESNIKSYRKPVKRHAARFCAEHLVGGAGSDERRPRCRLAPRGCGCAFDLSELCEGCSSIRPAPHQHRLHVALKKHLTAAAAIRAASSAVGSVRGAAAASLAAFKGFEYAAIEPRRPARRALAILLAASTLAYRRLINSLFAGRVLSWGARRRRRLAGAALQLPQGGASFVRLRPHRPRCAALAARVRCCLRAAEPCAAARAAGPFSR